MIKKSDQQPRDNVAWDVIGLIQQFAQWPSDDGIAKSAQGNEKNSPLDALQFVGPFVGKLLVNRQNEVADRRLDGFEVLCVLNQRQPSGQPAGASHVHRVKHIVHKRPGCSFR